MSPFFELSNLYKNMEDAYSEQREEWIIVAVDAYLDSSLKEQQVFIITQKSDERARADYVINQIRLNETEFRREKTYGLKVNQAKYHRQYKIVGGYQKNCANKLKVTLDLVIVFCDKDGAMSAFRRQRD